jgi:hypothetical protein
MMTNMMGEAYCVPGSEPNDFHDVGILSILS